MDVFWDRTPGGIGGYLAAFNLDKLTLVTGSKYVDDNARVGLAYLDAAEQITVPSVSAQYLSKAQAIFSF
jgi:hypothetical protein